MASDIVITPSRGSTTVNAKIDFTGASTASSQIRLEVLPDNSLAFVGTTGSLFSIADSVTGSLMSVNDASGLPILEVFDTDKVVMGQYNQNTLVVNGTNVGIGTASPGAKLEIRGGTTNQTNTDATVYITADSNNDWGLRVDKYRSGATNYGIRVDVVSGDNNAITVYGSNSEKARISGDGQIITSNEIRGTIFKDAVDTGYYVDPGSTSNLNGISTSFLTFSGTLFNASGSGAYYLGNWGGAGYWGLGPDSAAHTVRIDQTANGSTVQSFVGATDVNLKLGTYYVPVYGRNSNTSTLYATQFIDSESTGYLVDPGSTSYLNGLSVTSTISGNISGSAATASNLVGLTLTSAGNGINPDSVTQNQLGYNNSVNLFGQSDGGLYSSAYNSNWIHQIYGDFRTGQIAIRGKNNGSWQSWRAVLDSSNYTTYVGNGTLSLAVSGTGLSGSASFTANQSGNATFTVTSNATSANTGSTIVARDGNGDFAARIAVLDGYVRNNGSVSDDDGFGMYWSSDANTSYAIYREAGAWSHPYPDLRIAFHTGIKLGANSSYQGIKFYNDWDMVTQVMSVNNGSDGLGANNVYVNNSLQAGSSLRAPIFYDSDNTGYYLDPLSTSYLNNLYLYGALTVTGNTRLGQSSGTTTRIDDILQVGASDSGDSHLYFGEDSGNWYGAHWYWDSGYTHYWYSRNGGTDSTLMQYSTNDTTKITFGRNIEFNNYGKGIIGTYASTRYQGVFAMGESYKLPDDGTGVGTLYGIAWSHPNAGGAAANLASHGMLILENGTFKGAWGGGRLVTTSDIRGTIFYDYDNTGYYCDPNSTSNLWRPNWETYERWNSHPRLIDAGGQRPSITSSTDYWTGTTGWGTSYGTWGTYWKYGAGFFDCWGTSSDHPQGSQYVHAQGIQSGQHATSSDGSTGYGWQMVGAGDAANRWWLRGKWGGTTRPWYEIALYNSNVGGNLYADAFYDSGNTNYYVDPASTSRVNAISFVSGATFGPYFQYNNQSNLRLQGGASSEIGISGYDYNGNWRFQLYGQSGAYGFLNGNWAGWDLQKNPNGNLYLNGQTTYYVGTDTLYFYRVYGTADIRSPIFYDQDDTGYWIDPAGNTASSGLSGSLKYSLSVNAYGSSAGYGIALYPSYQNSGGTNTEPTYGVMFASSSTYGGHGAVASGDWATYFTMSNTDSRGWIFRKASAGNVASISGSGRMRIQSLGVNTDPSTTAGEIRATDNITAYYSDERLKTKLGPIENPIEKVKSLSGFYFEANETAVALGYQKKREVGVSAQEVQAVLPEIIAPAPIDEQYMTVRYEKLIPLLIEAIKEQQKQIEELKSLLSNNK